MSECRIYEEDGAVPFRIIKPLGHGGYGWVEEVQGTSGRFHGKIYARKTSMLQGCTREQERRRAQITSEVDLIKNLSHTHIVRLIAAYICRNHYAIIMDPVADMNLQEYLDLVDCIPFGGPEQQLREPLARWFGCLVNGLAYLHGRNIHHRDIKPQNILTKNGNVLLTDFGTSREFPDGTVSGETGTRGTLAYSAPELAKGSQPGRLADIYSLGAVFLEMVFAHSGPGQLSDFRESRRRGITRLYAHSTDVVSQWINTFTAHWINSFANSHHDQPWYSTILFLCRSMLQPIRGNRPRTDALRLCWAYYPFSAVPPTCCKCGYLPGQSNDHTGNGMQNSLPGVSPESEKFLGKLLCEKGGFEFRAADGGTALHHAVGLGQEGVVQLLIVNGADMNAKNKEGKTALHRAVELGLEGIVRLLVAGGADVNAQDNEGLTVLHRAARTGHEAIKQVLAQKEAMAVPSGTVTHITAIDTYSALQRAAENGNEAVLRLLVEMGGKINTKDERGRTALQQAVENGHEKIVRQLIKNGANVNTEDNDGWTVLHRAAMSGREVIVKELVENGADIGATYGFLKWTALHLAADRGHCEVVELLVAHGADIHAKDTDGRTALDLAAWNDQYEHSVVVRLLSWEQSSGRTIL